MKQNSWVRSVASSISCTYQCVAPKKHTDSWCCKGPLTPRWTLRMVTVRGLLGSVQSTSYAGGYDEKGHDRRYESPNIGSEYMTNEYDQYGALKHWARLAQNFRIAGSQHRIGHTRNKPILRARIEAKASAVPPYLARLSNESSPEPSTPS